MKDSDVFFEMNYLERSEEDSFLTVDEAAKLLNVSTKTISRWRKQGLESEMRLISGRNRIIIWRSQLESFAAAHPARVEKGSRFSQMTDEERHEIIERAKRMAAVGQKLTQVIRRLSESTGRSAETI